MKKTYSPVMEIITFIFLTCLAILDMHLMDVVATYLYRSLEKNIHMKIPEVFTMLEAICNELKSIYSIKL